MLQLAVAHVVHLTRAPKSSAEASDATNSGIATAYVRLAKNFSVSSKVRLGASLRAQPGQPSAAVERTVVAQLIGAYSLCSSYAKIREMLAGTRPKGPERIRRITSSHCGPMRDRSGNSHNSCSSV
jgi:hypothetical protein